MLLLAVLLAFTPFSSRLNAASSFESYARHYWSDADFSKTRVAAHETPQGAGLEGLISGVFTAGPWTQGMVIGFRRCPEGLCYADHVSLTALDPHALRPLEVFAPVDLGVPGELKLEPPPKERPAKMKRPALPVTSQHEVEGRETRTLTLIDLSGTEPRRLFQEDIGIKTPTGRRSWGQDLKLEPGEGETLDVTMTWKVMPGAQDHDAACLISDRPRRFRMGALRYEEVEVECPSCSGC